MSESFAELLEESLSKVEMRTGKVTKGLIVDMNDDVVIVNAGLKTEGEIPTFQFKDMDGEITVKIGDEVEVAIESLEDGTGSARLSREKAIRARAWDILEEGFEENAIVTGRITGKVKGGLTVSLGSIRAFLPGSLVDVRPVKDTAYLEGKDLEFKVIKLDRQRNNVVVSRRAVVEKELSAERDQLMENMEEGQIIKGIVKNLTDYGAFVNLGGLDGLLHITDISWKRVKHPSEVLTVGDEIEARVLKFDKERNRVSLGLKQMEDDPWGDLPKRYPRDTRLLGKVTNVTDYGAFVEIEDGVEGLVHVSEMDWTNKNTHPSKVVQVGDEVEVMVLDIDPERRRISLGMKQCKTNPWEAFAATHNKNDKVTGMIKSITDFGVFVGLDGAIDGLIHLSDLSWDQAGEEAVSNFKKGDEVEAIILAIDAERERISLGLKQVDGDPFTSYVAEHGKGAKVGGVVESVDAKGVVITLAENVTGYLRVSEISVDRVEDARNEFNEGDTVESKITSIDRKTRRISLSIKAFVAEQESEVLREYTGKQMSSTSSLGDAFKEQLSKK